MTLTRKMLFGAAALGTALMPILVQAKGIEAKVEMREAFRERFKDLFKGEARGDLKKGLGLGLGLRAKPDAVINATTTVEVRTTVRAFIQAWNEYRASAHVAEKVYKKSEHDARVALIQTLRVAAKAKDGAAAMTAVDAYFTSEAAADAKLDAARAAARAELKMDIKAIVL